MIKITIEGTPIEDQLVSSADFGAQFKNLFVRRGQDSALRVQERFSEVLRRGAPEDIGASGRAAENIATRSDSSKPSWEIYEGTGTVANQRIRNGIRRGRKVPIGTLRTWAAQKGVKLYWDAPGGRSPKAVLDRLTSVKGVEFNRSRWFGRVGIKPSSSLKPSQVTLKGLYALRFALWQHGTQRESANWFNKMPSGMGHFNYPLYVMQKDGALIDSIIQKLGEDVITEFNLIKAG